MIIADSVTDFNEMEYVLDYKKRVDDLMARQKTSISGLGYSSYDKFVYDLENILYDLSKKTRIVRIKTTGGGSTAEFALAKRDSGWDVWIMVFPGSKEKVYPFGPIIVAPAPDPPPVPEPVQEEPAEEEVENAEPETTQEETV